jgi:hypothetical protein
VLEVPESATLDEIRAAFRRLAKQYHPDVIAHLPEHLTKLRADAEEKFKKINEAWGILQDAAKKKQYDEELKTGRGQQPFDDPNDCAQASPPSYHSPAPSPSPPPSATASSGVGSSALHERRAWIVAAIVIGGLYFLPSIFKSLVPVSFQTGMVTTCSMVRGWQNFTAKTEFSFGQPICVYAEALNTNRGNRIDLVYTFTLLGPDHIAHATRSVPCVIPNTTAPNCEQNVPDLRLPANAPTGPYTLNVAVRDNLTGQTAQGASAFLVVPASNVNTGRELFKLSEAIREPFVGEASENAQRWPATLTFTRLDNQSGNFTGRLEWPTLKTVTKVEGVVYGSSLGFTQTEFIRGRNVQLGSIYDLELVEGDKLGGRWSYQGRAGPVWFTIPATLLSASTGQQERAAGDNSGTLGENQQQGESAINVLEIRTTPGDSTVYVDGRNYGESAADGTLSVRDVSVGSHEVVVHKAGYEDFRSPVLLTEGQGTKLVAQLKAIVGKLTFQTVPTADVIVDGAERGTADEYGYLAIYDLPIGSHQVTVRKTGYSDGQFMVELSPNETKNLRALLTWTGGYLTIHANPPGTTVTVSGLEVPSGGWSDSVCPPGAYTITASHAGMKTETRTVLVQAGQHASVDLSLSPDTTPGPSKKAEQGNSPASDGSPSVARTIIRALEPDLGASTLLSPASAYLRSDNLAPFQTGVTEILRQGGSVTIELMHEHSGLSGDSVHTAKVTLTSQTITYDPGNSSCKYSLFSAPLSGIETVEVSDKAVKEKMIGMVVSHNMPGTFLLHLDLRNPARGNDKANLYLVTSNSYTVKDQNRFHFLVSPSGSHEILIAVAEVIRNAATLRR